MLHHCWHDANVRFPPPGDAIKTVDAPTLDGRVCCYCNEIRPEPLPPMPAKPIHGPYVDDDSNWYLEDHAQCPGLDVVQLNLDPAVVPLQADIDG